MLDDSSAAATRMVVVDDGLRGDEELAIAILEKAVLGETVLDHVVLEQLKTYMRTGGGSEEEMGGGGSGAEAASQLAAAAECLDDVVRDLDNLSVSSSEEGDKFEDACGDVTGQVVAETRSDGLEKQASVPAQKQRTMSTGDVPSMIRTPAEGLDAAAAQAQAKLKERPVTKGKDEINSSTCLLSKVVIGSCLLTERMIGWLQVTLKSLIIHFHCCALLPSIRLQQ